MDNDQEDHLLQIVRQLADAILVLQRRVSILEQAMQQQPFQAGLPRVE